MKRIALLLCILLCCLPALASAAATALRCPGEANGMSGSGWPLRNYQVFAVDGSGLYVTDYTGTVTASLASSPGGATLTGTLTAVAALVSTPGTGTVSIATFSNLIPTGTGAYQLTFAAGGLSSCTTAAFVVGASYHLGSSSPARGLGLSIAGVVVTDFDGQSVPQSGAIDAGALQYRSQVVIPVVIPAPTLFRLGP